MGFQLGREKRVVSFIYANVLPFCLGSEIGYGFKGIASVECKFIDPSDRAWNGDVCQIDAAVERSVLKPRGGTWNVDARQARTACENIPVELCRVGKGDLGQTCAILEGGLLDRCKRFGKYDACQTRAALECRPTKPCDGIGNDDACQGSAAIERFTADVCEGVGQNDAC